MFYCKGLLVNLIDRTEFDFLGNVHIFLDEKKRDFSYIMFFFLVITKEK